MIDSNTTTILRGSDQSILRANVQVLLKRWGVIVVVVAVSTLAALGWSLSLSPVYQGTGTVMLDENAAALSGVPGLTAPSTSVLPTLAEVARSRIVLTRAAQSLKLPPDQERRALRTMRQGVRVTHVRFTDMLRIQVPGSSPEAAAAYTNAVVGAFITWHVEARRESAAAGRAFIADQLIKVGQELRQAEDALTKYKVSSGQIVLSQPAAELVTQLSTWESSLRSAVIDRKAVEANIASTRKQIGLQSPLVAVVAARIEDPVFVSLRETLVGLETQLALLREQYTDDYPPVRALLVQIEDVKRRMAAHVGIISAPQQQATNSVRDSLVGNLVDLTVQRQVALAREAALTNVLRSYERDAKALPPEELELARRTRAVLVAEGAYLGLATSLENAKVAEASIVGDLRVVDRAVPVSTPISPLIWLNTLLGAAAGLILGVGAVYVLEGLDTRFGTPEEAAAALGLPLLATIPAYRIRRGPADKGKITLVAEEHRRSPFAEAFRHLRTSLLYSNPDRPLRSILITSPGPGEGKSTVAANLAVVVTQTGQPVWLLECDMRRPSLIWTFQPKVPLGLSDLLVDGFPLDQALNPTAIGNLWFIAGGTTPPNPAELLGSQRMRTFIEQNARDAKMLVLDSAPVLPVTDAMVLSRVVDGVVFVLHLTKTPREAARRAVEQLSAMGARILGMVVNGVPTGRRSGYYAYYARYYGHDERDAVPGKSAPGTTVEKSAPRSPDTGQTPRR